MGDGPIIRALAGVAGHLSSAHDALADRGYEMWAGELHELIETITAEIAWLEIDDTTEFTPPV